MKLKIARLLYEQMYSTVVKWEGYRLDHRFERVVRNA